ncbi:Methionyl-tRNA formyltransferase, partial [Coemansia spiralis]
MLALFGGRSRGIARIGCAALRCPFAFTRSTAEGARAYTADNSINQRPSLGHSQVSNHGLSVLFIGSGGFSTAVLSNLERYFRHKDTVIGGLEVMCKRPHVFIRDRNPEVKKVPAHIEASVRGLQLHYFDPKVSLPWSAPRPKQSELGRFDIAVMCTDAPKLPKTFIDGFPLGVLRVHPSLLPKHRGGAPIQAALLAGDSVTG